MGDPDLQLRAAPVGEQRRSTNLRLSPDPFVGRTHELAALAQLLLSGNVRLLTLLAPGGYGKSRLAHELCTQLLGRSEHGVYEVRLAGLSRPQRVPEAIAVAVDFHFAGTREPRLQLIDYLREKELLLHFDSFEQLLPATPLLAEILAAAPGVHLLVTSRSPLGLAGEQVFELGPLTTGPGSDSVYMFALRAQQALPGFALADCAGAVQSICAMLQGVPLAIELAAAGTRRMPPAEIERALSARLTELASDSELPAAQQAVRAACDWSWSLLTPDQQTALMQLATFRGGFSPVQAQALLGTGGPRMQEQLAELSALGWLQHSELDGKPHYSIRNNASREYAWTQLGAAQPDGTEDSLFERSVRAHARCFAELLAVEGELLKGKPGHASSQLSALHRLKLLEQEDLLAALDTALERDDLSCLLPLAQHLGRLMEMTSEFALLQETYTRLFDSALRQAQPELELYARSGLVAAAYRLGDFDECVQQARAVDVLAQQLGRPVAAADAQRSIALVEYTRGNYQRARELMEAALVVSRTAGDRFSEAAILNHLGNAAVLQDERAVARQYFERCIELRRADGDRYGEAMSLNNLGNLELREGQFATGVELLKQCLAIRREVCDLSGQAATLGNLGIAQYSLGEVDQARESFRQALAIQRSLGDRLAVAGTLNNLGAVERGQRSYSAASEMYRQAIQLSREIGYGLAEATALLNLGNAQAGLGDHSAAARTYSEALPLQQQLGGLSLLPKTVALAGATLAHAGAWAPAVTALAGGAAHCPVHHGRVEPDEQELLDAAWARIEQEVAAQRWPAAETEQLKAQAPSRTIEELTASTLAALQQSGSLLDT